MPMMSGKWRGIASATLRSCFLYEFLLALTVITIIFQLSAFIDIPSTEEVGDANPSFPLEDTKVAPVGIKQGRSKHGNSEMYRSESSAKTTRRPKTEKHKVPRCTNGTYNYNILIYGGMNIIKQWVELRELVNNFKVVEKNQHVFEYLCTGLNQYEDLFPENETYPCESKITVTLSSNRDTITGKDVVVLGISPYSLKVKTKFMRTTDFAAGQLFVFYGVETPLRMHKWINDIGRQPVHIVWSYSSSSEVFMPYSRYDPSVPFDQNDKSDEILKSKTKLISWMGSNCEKEVFWPRMDFLNELQKYIPVDLYGKCGNLTCLPRMSDHCKQVMEQYKFYLALENAECEDYITEKFWESSLQHNAVPVVYGARKENYQKFAPPDSFIHVSDFSSIKELADYLLILDRNERLYKRYFAWRTKGSIRTVFPPLQPSSFCSLIPHFHQLKRGRLSKSELQSTPWFQGCRVEIAKTYPKVEITDWTAWK